MNSDLLLLIVTSFILGQISMIAIVFFLYFFVSQESVRDKKINVTLPNYDLPIVPPQNEPDKKRNKEEEGVNHFYN